MSNAITITLPIYWQYYQKSLVGMNWYRNAHFHLKNRWKVEFTDMVHSQLDLNTKIKSPYGTRLVLYYKQAKCDAGNITALSEKAALDALQSAGITEEDSVKHHIKSEWTIGGQDKENPRCEITIYEL